MLEGYCTMIGLAFHAFCPNKNNSRRVLFALTLLLAFLPVACVSVPSQKKSLTADDIHLRLQVLKPGVDRFKNDGPFEVEEYQDTKLNVSATEVREVDVYKTKARGRAPVVIMSHGNFSGKRAHADQARRLASWGFHVIVAELPNRNQWLDNGRRILDLSLFIRGWPRFLGENADSTRIILIGHSFGGSAVTLAASERAPIVGVILLDPAIVHPTVTAAMTRINVPAILLGADPKVFQARGRQTYRKKWNGPFLEVTIAGSTHDDAQGPSMFSTYSLGIDPFTDNTQRETFKASLVSAAVSLASAGNLEMVTKDFSVASLDGDLSQIFMRR
jgi:dienelactone hydrolase